MTFLKNRPEGTHACTSLTSSEGGNRMASNIKIPRGLLTLRNLLASVIALALLGLLGGTAIAKDYKVEGAFAWVAKGEVLQIGKDQYYWVGSYNGMNVLTDPSNPLQGAAVVCPGANQFGVAAGGFCQDIVDKDNIVYIKWQSDAQAPAGHGSYKVIGGTGKFANASGGGEFAFVYATAPNPDGTQSGNTTYQNAVLTLP